MYICQTDQLILITEAIFIVKPKYIIIYSTYTVYHIINWWDLYFIEVFLNSIFQVL